MLFENLLGAPAPGPIKLDDQRCGIDPADLIDAIFVAVERLQSPVTAMTGLFNGTDNRIRIQVRVGAGRIVWFWRVIQQL